MHAHHEWTRDFSKQIIPQIIRFINIACTVHHRI